MRENDGRKLDHKTLETLRLRAVDQVRGGEHPEDVAAALGMDRSTVYGWVAKAARDGREALRARPVPGRPPKLSPEQAQRVYQVVVGKNPTQVGFDFGLWTRDLVRQVIANEFKVKMSAVSVGRLLARLGLSPQRPVHRAWQADEEKVAAWKQTEYPKIAAAAKKAGAVVYFGDEASVRSDHHAGTTWAPVGRTPVVTQGTGARFSVNMVSAVTATGQLRFQIVDGTMTGPKFVEFCKRLLADTDRPVVLVVDNHRVHHSKVVREWVATTDGRFTLAYLPPYSPQLNPDELVWNNVKNHHVAKRTITSPDQLTSLCLGALRRLQKLPATVRGFFGHPDLAYIHAAEA